LLTTSVDASGARQVDVAHEALIRGWPRARRWIEDNRTALRTHNRITEAAQEWLRMERDESVLYRGARLAQAQEWREHRDDDLNDLEREFLDTSVARQERDAEEARERRRCELAQAQALAEEQARGRKRLRYLAGVLAALFAIEQRQAAEARRQESIRLRLISIAQALAGQAPRQRDQGKQDERGALLARQAYLFNQRNQGHVVNQVDEALRAADACYFSHLLRGHERRLGRWPSVPTGTGSPREWT
jgi:hypothetical protein